MSVRIEHGDCREVLVGMEPSSVQCCITSPPYFGLRDYKLEPLVWGGEADCEHEWSARRYYREGGGSVGSHEAFSKPGPENAERLKRTRWREDTLCRRCGAWRGQLGLEPTPELYLAHIVECFRAVKRVLRKDGTLWLNMGDVYAATGKFGGGTQGERYSQVGAKARYGKGTWEPVPFGLKPKDLMLMPFEVARALRADGWWLRSDIIWAKPNPMPESVTDRPTQAYKHVFLFSRAERYFYDAEAVRERAIGCNAHDLTGQGYAAPGQTQQKGNREKGRTRGLPPRHSQYDSSARESLDDVGRGIGRNLRNVWEIATAPYPKAHFATFPPKLVEPMVKAGTSEKGCCPECGGPWIRETETEYRKNRPSAGNDPRSRSEDKQALGSPGGHHGWRGNNLLAETATVGWSPSCSCTNDDIRTINDAVSCTILDPFSGAGTVGLVADRLGRDAILIDSKAEYCEMARERVEADAGLFAGVT